MITDFQNQDIYYELDSFRKSTDQAEILIDSNRFSEDRIVIIHFMFYLMEKYCVIGKKKITLQI